MCAGTQDKTPVFDIYVKRAVNHRSVWPRAGLICLLTFVFDCNCLCRIYCIIRQGLNCGKIAEGVEFFGLSESFQTAM